MIHCAVSTDTTPIFCETFCFKVGHKNESKIFQKGKKDHKVVEQPQFLPIFFHIFWWSVELLKSHRSLYSEVIFAFFAVTKKFFFQPSTNLKVEKYSSLKKAQPWLFASFDRTLSMLTQKNNFWRDNKKKSRIKPNRKASLPSLPHRAAPLVPDNKRKSSENRTSKFIAISAHNSSSHKHKNIIMQR